MRGEALLVASVVLAGCHSCVPVVPPDEDGGRCGQAGAWVHDHDGYHQVSGLTQKGSDLSWLVLPEGFCARWYGRVGNAREIRFAPSGELFVASPMMATTSGGPGGLGGIAVLADDDHDGLADGVVTWRSGLTSTQGLLFVDGGFYFQNGSQIMREPYTAGDRAPKGLPTPVADIQVYVSTGHWPKTLDISDDGTIYVTNGGDQGETCDPAHPFRGGIVALDPDVDSGARLVAKGLRNPIYLRCHHDGHNRCFANELARDYSGAIGGREKLIPVRDGDDWGYPCCASTQLPYDDVCLVCGANTVSSADSSMMCRTSMSCSPLCAGVTPDSDSFVIGDTPFGLDFIDGQFPAPWDHRVYVAPHGAFGTWTGARVVGIAFDPATGLPMGGTNLPGADAGAMVDFLGGWDDGTKRWGRPADLTVSSDGRLFISNDETGDIIWVGPVKQ